VTHSDRIDIIKVKFGSLGQLARALNVSTSYISLLVKRERKSDKYEMRISEMIGVKPEILWGWETCPLCGHRKD
jgi:lambda repressor-like predicted transcriptional regulator